MLRSGAGARRVKGLFDELKPSKEAAGGKDEERMLRAEMGKNVGADYYGFNRDEDDGTKGLERAGEEGAPEWVVPRLDEVTEFLVKRRKSQNCRSLSRGGGTSGEGVGMSSFFGGGREGNCLRLLSFFSMISIVAI